MTFKTPMILASALLAGTALAGPAAAASLVGLVDGTSIVLIDPQSLKVTETVKIADGGELIGIDVRPADGMLYGVTTTGSIVTVDPASGKWTEKSKLSETLKDGVTATVDFNPTADRLRIMGDDGTSLRVNVDDGKVTVDGSHKWAEGDKSAGSTPDIVAGAYTNSANGKKAEKTELYNVDASGTIVLQNPPNDGTLNTVGSLGMKPSGPVGFNIVADGSTNTAWLTHEGTLYSVDLKTGAPKEVGKIEGVEGDLVDIAWWE